MMVNDDDDNDNVSGLVSTYRLQYLQCLPTLSYLGHLIRHLPSSSQHVCSYLLGGKVWI